MSFTLLKQIRLETLLEFCILCKNCTVLIFKLVDLWFLLLQFLQGRQMRVHYTAALESNQTPSSFARFTVFYIYF